MLIRIWQLHTQDTENEEKKEEGWREKEKERDQCNAGIDSLYAESGRALHSSLFSLVGCLAFVLINYTSNQSTKVIEKREGLSMWLFPLS